MGIVALRKPPQLSGITKPPYQVAMDRDNPLVDAMVHCYLFNEGGGGFVNDAFRPGFRGAISAGGWATSPRGIVLDSTATVAGGAVADWLISTNLTLEIWVNILNASALKKLVMLGDDSSHSFGLEQNNGSGLAGTLITLYISGIVHNGFSSGSYTAEAGVWRQYVLTRDATTWTFYVDTVSKATGTQSPNALIANTTGFIPDANAAQVYMSRMWSRVLSTAEINETFRNPMGMFTLQPRGRMQVSTANRGLFRINSDLNGIGSGGAYFVNPVG